MKMSIEELQEYYDNIMDKYNSENAIYESQCELSDRLTTVLNSVDKDSDESVHDALITFEAMGVLNTNGVELSDIMELPVSEKYKMLQQSNEFLFTGSVLALSAIIALFIAAIVAFIALIQKLFGSSGGGGGGGGGGASTAKKISSFNRENASIIENTNREPFTSPVRVPERIIEERESGAPHKPEERESETPRKPTPVINSAYAEFIEMFGKTYLSKDFTFTKESIMSGEFESFLYNLDNILDNKECDKHGRLELIKDLKIRFTQIVNDYYDEEFTSEKILLSVNKKIGKDLNLPFDNFNSIYNRVLLTRSSQITLLGEKDSYLDYLKQKPDGDYSKITKPLTIMNEFMNSGLEGVKFDTTNIHKDISDFPRVNTEVVALMNSIRIFKSSGLIVHSSQDAKYKSFIDQCYCIIDILIESEYSKGSDIVGRFYEDFDKFKNLGEIAEKLKLCVVGLQTYSSSLESAVKQNEKIIKELRKKDGELEEYGEWVKQCNEYSKNLKNVGTTFFNIIKPLTIALNNYKHKLEVSTCLVSNVNKLNHVGKLAFAIENLIMREESIKKE